MRCTNCKALRPIEKPLIPDQCPLCYQFVENGMQTYSDIQRCDPCFRTQLAAVDEKQKEGGSKR